MVRTRVETESMPAVETGPTAESDELLLGAALAAVLVEHRRCVTKGGELTQFTGGGTNWRMMARWAQLAGPAPGRGQGRP